MATFAKLTLWAVTVHPIGWGRYGHGIVIVRASSAALALEIVQNRFALATEEHRWECDDSDVSPVPLPALPGIVWEETWEE